MGCPSLVCYPYIALPHASAYENIARFATIAREHGLAGLNTTIWIPQRFISDALWPGIAWAAARSWNGSRWDAEALYGGFMSDFFGSSEGCRFGRAWERLADLAPRMPSSHTCWWADDASLADARALVAGKGAEFREQLARAEEVRQDIESLGKTVHRNREAWLAIVQSAGIVAYTLDHLLAAPGVTAPLDAEGRATVERLDRGCVEAAAWIEADWDRNRYPDDPNKNGIHLPGQHLLWRFRQMHAFHGELLDRR